jgi:ferric-dicitrate binding protein FerR (iron transport regulator)
MDKDIPWDKIIEYLRNGRKDADDQLINWIRESKLHRDIFDEILVVNELSSDLPEAFIPDKEKAWENIEGRISPSKSHHRVARVLLKFAAAIVLLIVGFSLSLLDNQEPVVAHGKTQIQASKGQKAHIMLPDSSSVVLNGGTTLVYADNFLSDRKVELIGEALFDVKKNDSGGQFVVKTPLIDIEVVGTKFNVQAYSEDSEIEIALVEGEIGLSQSGSLLSSLSPGQVATLDKQSNTIEKTSENVSKIIAWASDELIFEDRTFDEIATYLERWYGVEIELQESLKKQHRYTFSVKTESLRELLNLISLITPIEYKIDGKKVIIIKNS